MIQHELFTGIREKSMHWLVMVGALTCFPTLGSLHESLLPCNFNDRTTCNWIPQPNNSFVFAQRFVTDQAPGIQSVPDFYISANILNGKISLESRLITLLLPSQLFFEYFLRDRETKLQVTAVALDSSKPEILFSKDEFDFTNDVIGEEKWTPVRIPLCLTTTAFWLEIKISGISGNRGPSPAFGIDTIRIVKRDVPVMTPISPQNHRKILLVNQSAAVVADLPIDLCHDQGYPNYSDSITCTLYQLPLAPLPRFCGWRLADSWSDFTVIAGLRKHLNPAIIRPSWYYHVEPDHRNDEDTLLIFGWFDSAEVCLGNFVDDRPQVSTFSFWYAQKNAYRCEARVFVNGNQLPVSQRLSNTSDLEEIQWRLAKMNFSVAPRSCIQFKFALEFRSPKMFPAGADTERYFKLDRTWYNIEPGFVPNITSGTPVAEPSPTAGTTPELVQESSPSRPNTLHTTSSTTVPVEGSTSGTTDAVEGSTSGTTVALGNASSTSESGYEDNGDEGSPSDMGMVIGVSVASSVVVLSIISVAAVLYVRHRRLLRQRGSVKHDVSGGRRSLNLYTFELQIPAGETDAQLVISQYTQLLAVSKITLEISDTVLGRGEFGIVFKGLAHKLPTVSKGPTVVAIKTLVQNADRDQQSQFIEEYKVMLKAGRHINLVNILGIVQEEPPLLVLEYCRHGSLLSYIRNRRNGAVYSQVDESGKLLKFDEHEMRTQWIALCQREGRNMDSENMTGDMLSTDDLIRFSHQICRGMEYLASRKIIHRDLAARNMLVADDRILKIADFGLAKSGGDSYTVSNVLIALPVLWMPPDTITHREFSEKSDVWAFGIVLWEIFSLGQVPFDRPNVTKFSANAFAEWLQEGHQMARPDGAPNEIYIVMQHCWRLDAGVRPTFSQLCMDLDKLVTAGVAATTSYLPLDDIDYVHSADIAHERDEHTC